MPNEPDNEGLRSGVALSMDDMMRAFREVYARHIEEMLYSPPSLLGGSYGFFGINKYIKPEDRLEYELVDTDLP